MRYRTKKIQKKDAQISKLYSVTWYILIVFSILALVSSVMKQRESAKTAVDPASFVISSTEIPENNYRIEVKKENDYNSIMIQGYELKMTDADYEAYFGNTQSVKTAIYVTTYEMPNNSFFKNLLPNKVVVARFSFIDQGKMTKEEADSLRERAATYLTQARQKEIGLDVEVEQMPNGFSIRR